IISTLGFTWAALLAAMIHPTPWMDIGIQYRPQIDIHTDGTLKSVPPAGMAPQRDSPVTFTIIEPHHFRLGVRAVRRFSDGAEQADVELDATYEAWGSRRDRWGRNPDTAY